MRRRVWRELKSVADKQLPILVLNNGAYLAGGINIKNYLEGKR